MKYICNFCTTEFFSAVENLDGTKCWNCKKGRVANAETELIDEFLAELDKELEEFEIELGIEHNSDLFDLAEFEVKLEVCKKLACDNCSEDCSDEPLACDPNFLKPGGHDTPSFQKIMDEHSRNEGLMSGMKNIADNNIESLKARIYGGIKRKSGEYCRNCTYYQIDSRTEGKTHYSEGNCTIESWKRKIAFDWCKHYNKRKKNTGR